MCQTAFKTFSHKALTLTLFCSGSHLGFPVNTEGLFRRDHPMIICVQFKSIKCVVFESYMLIWVCIAHLCIGAHWEKDFYSYSLRDLCWRMFRGSGHLGFSIHTTDQCKRLSINSLDLIYVCRFWEKILIFPFGPMSKHCPAVAAILDFHLTKNT